DDLVNTPTLVHHARTVTDQNTFVLASADRIPVRNDWAALNEIVRNVGDEFKEVLQFHPATVHFNIHEAKLAHAECVQPDLVVRSADELKSKPNRYGYLFLRNVLTKVLEGLP